MTCRPVCCLGHGVRHSWCSLVRGELCVWSRSRGVLLGGHSTSSAKCIIHRSCDKAGVRAMSSILSCLQGAGCSWVLVHLFLATACTCQNKALSNTASPNVASQGCRTVHSATQLHRMQLVRDATNLTLGPCCLAAVLACVNT